MISEEQERQKPIRRNIATTEKRNFFERRAPTTTEKRNSLVTQASASTGKRISLVTQTTSTEERNSSVTPASSSAGKNKSLEKRPILYRSKTTNCLMNTTPRSKKRNKFLPNSFDIDDDDNDDDNNLEEVVKETISDEECLIEKNEEMKDFEDEFRSTNSQEVVECEYDNFKQFPSVGNVSIRITDLFTIMILVIQFLCSAYSVYNL